MENFIFCVVLRLKIKLKLKIIKLWLINFKRNAYLFVSFLHFYEVSQASWYNTDIEEMFKKL